MKPLFWGSLGLILYAYVGFPLLLLLRGLLRRRPYREAEIEPDVTLLIVAHNEEASIAAKLDSVLALDYPRAKLQIIVASDGSDDRTEQIVAGYANEGVRLLPFPRQGKIPVLNAAAAQASGEILLFSDANSLYAPDALRHLVRPFADPTIGAVAGNQVYSSSAGNAASVGEQLYWRFDRLLKSTQSRAGNAISATGAIYAIRRALFRPVPLGVGDDFVISTRAILQGYRLVFAPDAVASEPIAPSDEAEFKRKVRIIVRGLLGLWAVRELFNPLRYGFYSVQIFSHKLLRWSVGWLMLLMALVSVPLARRGRLYRVALLGQLAFYTAAGAALALRETPLARRKGFKLLTIPYYFCLANFAAVRAWLQLLGGERIDVWDSKRHPIEAMEVEGSP